VGKLSRKIALQVDRAIEIFKAGGIVPLVEKLLRGFTGLSNGHGLYLCQFCWQI
jgi:hypothetical protein